MRKSVLILFLMLSIIALVACGGNNASTDTDAENTSAANSDNSAANGSDDSSAETPTEEPTEEPPAEPTDAPPTAEPTATAEAVPTDDSSSDDSDDDAEDDAIGDDSADDSGDDSADDSDDQADDDTLLGDPARGEELYNAATIGTSGAALGCAVCHSIAEGTVVVGPSHFDLATVAETRVPGMSAIEYLRESILNPNAYIVEGFAPDIMFQRYGEELTEQDIADLVAYLLTLQ